MFWSGNAAPITSVFSLESLESFSTRILFVLIFIYRKHGSNYNIQHTFLSTSLIGQSLQYVEIGRLFGKRRIITVYTVQTITLNSRRVVSHLFASVFFRHNFVKAPPWFCRHTTQNSVHVSRVRYCRGYFAFSFSLSTKFIDLPLKFTQIHTVHCNCYHIATNFRSYVQQIFQCHCAAKLCKLLRQFCTFAEVHFARTCRVLNCYNTTFVTARNYADR